MLQVLMFTVLTVFHVIVKAEANGKCGKQLVSNAVFL